MSLGMSRTEARKYRKRWKRVNAAEREELRRTGVELKTRQLASLMGCVDDFPWGNVEEEISMVRNRWIRLRKVMHVQE